MNCHRCQGLLVEDYFFDMEESFGHLWIKGWRCVICGDVSDPLINRRRLIQSLCKPEPQKALDEKGQQDREMVSLEW